MHSLKAGSSISYLIGLFAGVVALGLFIFFSDTHETQECIKFSVDECPDRCVVCPPCAVCSSISCQSAAFCSSIGFNKSWYQSMPGLARH